MRFFEKIKQGLAKTREGMKNSIESIINSFTRIDDDLLDELEEVLILSDIGAATSQEIISQLKIKIKEKGITDPQQIKAELKAIISQILGEFVPLDLSGKPTVVLVIGVNGVGKTTTIGKLATNYVKEGKKVLLAAADTFRAAAVEQLCMWAERSGSDIVTSFEGADPASVVFDAISSAKAKDYDIVICDTAGRLHNKKNLMDELSKISRVISREMGDVRTEALLVLDATTGQNAVNQAKLFGEVAGITGIILTKLDGTAKGGVVISIKNELDIPVRYIGVGEQADDLQEFDPKMFAEAIFEV
ncbi:MAG: signal recognition particle-docking protein FtsY [Oscillospiraceae bacterium]|nr:signal recognition particle-docking protein FtsY [Oscillospiraceae bacterium]